MQSNLHTAQIKQVTVDNLKKKIVLLTNENFDILRKINQYLDKYIGHLQHLTFRKGVHISDTDQYIVIDNKDLYLCLYFGLLHVHHIRIPLFGSYLVNKIHVSCI